jgi:hypothetical protein
MILGIPYMTIISLLIVGQIELGPQRKSQARQQQTFNGHDIIEIKDAMQKHTKVQRP